MKKPSVDAELRERAIRGVGAEVKVFSAGAAGSELIERDGVLAAVVPATPDRSLPNSVTYRDAPALVDALDELASVYAARGVRAWTIWVPESDREIAELLAGRGHVLDAAPRLMGMDLVEIAVPEPEQGIEIGSCTAAVAGRLNDLAYGYSTPAFAAMLRDDAAIRWTCAYRDGEPVACVGAIDYEGDCGLTAVATLSAERGRGIASLLMRASLRDAVERGLTTASLQATKLGAGVYERIGFRDVGCIEMWERRIPGPDG